ncbi:unnamed protein product [Pieris brassicae]|uniref:Hcy-binding domain-containing protein n=1 Tax=Pieris brassicae TaxID=7116 RepID=A0A9P0TEN3_PIEBR|nr:unnamed protein product [Pieris brassicae]
MIEINLKNVENIYVLDGGFSSQLSRHIGVSPDGDPLWTSRFLQTHSQEIVDTHLDFIRAGSDIISTNTYQASVGAFMKHLGISSDEGLSLMKHAVRLAQQARSEYIDECKSNDLTPRNILIAGSVGPFGASLNDGSEYSGNYIKTISEKHIQQLNIINLD